MKKLAGVVAAMVVVAVVGFSNFSQANVARGNHEFLQIDPIPEYTLVDRLIDALSGLEETISRIEGLLEAEKSEEKSEILEEIKGVLEYYQSFLLEGNGVLEAEIMEIERDLYFSALILNKLEK